MHGKILLLKATNSRTGISGQVGNVLTEVPIEGLADPAPSLGVGHSVAAEQHLLVVKR